MTNSQVADELLPKQLPTKFVCGADITFGKDGEKFAACPMGVFDTEAEAVMANALLHPSFGYNIYEVSSEIKSGLTIAFGIRQGASVSGFKVLRLACCAFDHPAWPM